MYSFAPPLETSLRTFCTMQSEYRPCATVTSTTFCSFPHCYVLFYSAFFPCHPPPCTNQSPIPSSFRAQPFSKEPTGVTPLALQLGATIILQFSSPRLLVLACFCRPHCSILQTFPTSAQQICSYIYFTFVLTTTICHGYVPVSPIVLVLILSCI